jgi:hypothetical protein
MPPSVPERLAALEEAILTDRARRLALLRALLTWTQDVGTNDGFDAFVAHLEERIAEEDV